ncbi:MAG: MFS transporter [Bacillota bacterium]|nr:MFS transporter [Bacillota bacterium]MDW7730331.1 MFS transporter [Bacillota bacterium]
MQNNRSLIAINVSVFLIMLGVGMIVALLPQRIIDLSGSVSAVGLLASVFAITYVLAQIPIGHLADKIGFKKLLIAGYLICGTVGLLYLGAKTSNHILMGRFLQGMGEVPIWALAPALLSLQYAEIKGKVIGLYNASLHLGLCIGPLLGMLLVRTEEQGGSAFIFFAFVSFTGGLIMYLFVEDFRPVTTIERFNPGKMFSLLSENRVLVVLIGISLYGAAYGLMLTIIPAFLITIKSFNQTMISLMFSLFYIAVSLSQLAAGSHSDRKGRRGMMIWGLIFAAAGMAFFSPLQSPLIYLLIALASFGLGMFSVSSMAHLNESVADSLKGTISGAFYLFWGVGFFLGPLLAGKTSETAGFGFSFYLLAILITAETLLLGISLPSGKVNV